MLGWRHVVTGLGFIGFYVIYSLRVNLSVAMVAMVNHTAIGENKNKDVNATDYCPYDPHTNSSASKEDGTFSWDEATQGYILGSFFYGYLITQVPGGWLAGRFGGKWVMGVGTLWTAVLSMLTPLAAQAGVGYFIALRILMGFGEGVTFPSMHSLFSRWAPPLERSILPSITYSGCLMGTVVSFAASGYMSASSFLGGWPSVFYVFGFVGCVWFIFWAIFVTDGPSNHRWVSEREKNFITSEIAKEKPKKNGRRGSKGKETLDLTSFIHEHLDMAVQMKKAGMGTQTINFDYTQFINDKNKAPALEGFLDEVQGVFAGQGTLEFVRAPVVVVGDIHGQFLDLYRVFMLGGWPAKKRYLFLGDYVDRGSHSLECIFFLFALFLKYPRRVVLLRGNHECQHVNSMYGFLDECQRRLTTSLYHRFQVVFNWMPLAARIGRKILCMHGGISPEIKTYDDILAIPRPTEATDPYGITADLLWSDPDFEQPYWKEGCRGTGWLFGEKALREFLSSLDLQMVIRAHQVVQQGYQFFGQKQLITVFTAPNYCNEFANDGAFLLISKELKNPSVPWGKILTSGPVWAIIVSHTAQNWGFYTLLTELPAFLESVLHFDIKTNGIISALPYIFQFFVQVSMGFTADWMRSSRRFSTTTVRKLYDCIGHIIPGVCLMGVGYVGCNRTAAVLILTFSVAITGLNSGSGYQVNHLDIAPQFAGVLYGVSNTVATIPGILGPYLVGLITNHRATVGAWRIVFFVTSAIYLISAIVYGLFGSGEVQSWAKEEDEKVETPADPQPRKKRRHRKVKPDSSDEQVPDDDVENS